MEDSARKGQAEKIAEQLRLRLPVQGVVNQTALLLEAGRDWLTHDEPGAIKFIAKLYSAVLGALPMVPLAKAVREVETLIEHPLSEWTQVEKKQLAEAIEQSRAMFATEINHAAEDTNRWASQYRRVIIAGGIDAESETALKGSNRGDYQAVVIEPLGFSSQNQVQLQRTVANLPNATLLQADGVTSALQWGEALLLANALTSSGHIYGNPSMTTVIEMAFPRVRDLALLRPNLRQLVPADQFTFKLSDIFTSVANERVVRTFIGAVHPATL